MLFRKRFFWLKQKITKYFCPQIAVRGFKQKHFEENKFHRSIRNQKLGKVKKFQVWVVGTSLNDRAKNSRGGGGDSSPPPPLSGLIGLIDVKHAFVSMLWWHIRQPTNLTGTPNVNLIYKESLAVDLRYAHLIGSYVKKLAISR